MKRLVLFLLCLVLVSAALAQTPRWSAKEANDWYAKQPWLVGSNYIPSYAINQLEMWQADTFGPKTIDRELGWAQDLGAFQDSDGKGYLVYDDGHRNLRVDLLKDDFLDVAGKSAIAMPARSGV